MDRRPPQFGRAHDRRTASARPAPTAERRPAERSRQRDSRVSAVAAGVAALFAMLLTASLSSGATVHAASAGTAASTSATEITAATTNSGAETETETESETGTGTETESEIGTGTAAESESGTETASGTPPTTALDNDFIPEERNLTDCIGVLQRPGCGSEARGGWRQGLVFAAVIGGLAIVFWRVRTGVMRNRAALGEAMGGGTTQR